MHLEQCCGDMEPLAALLARAWSDCGRAGDHHGQIACLTTLAQSVVHLQRALILEALDMEAAEPTLVA
jgi:hypothetical protein